MSLISPSSRIRLRGGLHFALQAATRRFGNARRLIRERNRFYDHIWRSAAESLGAQVADLGDGLLEISNSRCATRLWRNYTPLDDPVTLRFAGNKPAVLQRLNEMGIPTPNWITFSAKDLASANDFLQGRTCVVKPARYTGAGSGVTTGVQTAAQLFRAAGFAAACDPLLLMEEQVEGDNYRLLFLDGELLEIVRRGRPCLHGDGRSSLRELIARENSLRDVQCWQRAQTLLTIDFDLRRTLAAQNLSLRSKPAAGRVVPVKTVINENRAAENEVIDFAAPEIVDQCRQAAAAVGASLAGVDIVASDLHRPLAESGGVVLEVNTTPGLYHHFDPRRGECRVTEAILSACLRESLRRDELQQRRMEQVS